VNPRRTYAITFGIGSALAGAAGGLYGMVQQVTPYIGVTLTAKSFIIAILGGLDKPIGVVIGGLILGIAEVMAALYLDPIYTDIISFGLLVVVLVARPAQLVGRA
jgi:branched-chain amino acid transport system permease protein